MKKIYLVFTWFILCVSAWAQPSGNTTWIAAGMNPASMVLSSSYDLKTKSSDVDYTKGVFIVNEDWYGHQNSTVNFLTDEGEWMYRVFQKENPGHELGCTTQYGTIYGGRFYLVSKQQQDPGAKVKGSRLAITDAETMKLIKEFEYIATKTVKGKNGQDSIVSIADGRSFLPISEKKGYIGTSNGIWLFDMEQLKIGGQIKGTGNPNESGYGQLYYAQIGTMVRVDDYVLAVHQQEGILVIDPETDTLIRTIKPPIYLDNKGKEKSRGFGSIVQSKDGSLWISMAENTLGKGGALHYMLKMDQHTLKVDTIHFPTEKGIEAIPNSWYAWTADGFCASKQENKIYWNGYGTGSWFTGYKIFCYDIDKDEFSLHHNIEAIPGRWRLYGTGFRIHPVTDEIYAFLYHEFEGPIHMIVRIDNKGKLLGEYPLITNYWFPAIPVFPDNHAPVVQTIPEIRANTQPVSLSLKEYVTDADNLEASIIKKVINNTAPSLFDAAVKNGKLRITPLTDQEGTGVVTVQFNSNGKLTNQNVHVKVGDRTVGVENINVDTPFVCSVMSRLRAVNSDGYNLSLYNLQGQMVAAFLVQGDNWETSTNVLPGAYIVTGSKGAETFTKKIIIK